MEREQWLILLLTGLGLGLMLCFSLKARPQSSLTRWTGRIFWAIVFMEGAACLGITGRNLWTLAAAALLGWPGAGAIAVLSLV
ncbi:MAG: hypothetical protein E7324_05695 [Clostridiales bacterium]|nr:hypothetical protein [Clostridiales bacterium]